MKGAQLLVRALEQEGVEVVFGYPGGAIMPVYDALIDSPIRHILARHEQGAALAADGYARVTGRPGICMATSGPGATNLVTGIANAYMDSIPIVAITGQVPTPVMGTDAFQEVDTVGITRPCTKHNYLVKDTADLARVVRERDAAALAVDHVLDDAVTVLLDFLRRRGGLGGRWRGSFAGGRRGGRGWCRRDGGRRLSRRRHCGWCWRRGAAAPWSRPPWRSRPSGEKLRRWPPT